MDLNNIGSFISTVGFPIAVSCALLFAFWQIYKRMNNMLDKVNETNEMLVETNSQLIAKMDLKLDTMNTTLTKIYDKVTTEK